jgi:SAM-dependent methyltransferase
MPTMYEIYQSHSCEYDELVNHEDYKGNLRKYLLDNFDFDGKTVIELGAGTGRVTDIYAARADRIFLFDKSRHMIEKAKENLHDHSKKIRYDIKDNMDIENVKIKANIVLEGWSFGHTISENRSQIYQTANKLISDCKSMLIEKGTIIIMETLGTNTENPKAPSEYLLKFYNMLESEYGFRKKILRTDYRFVSNAEAKRITGYFFGSDFEKNLFFDEVGIVKEFTGVWSVTKSRCV